MELEERIKKEFQLYNNEKVTTLLATFIMLGGSLIKQLIRSIE